MNDLSPDAAALIRAGRKAFRPNASDRDRVLRCLNISLGEGALADATREGLGTEAAAASRLALRTWIVGGLSAVAIGTGALVAPRLWTQAPARVESAPAASAPAVAEPAPSATPSPTESPPFPPSPHAGRGPVSPKASAAPAARLPSDSLSEEVRLLSLAQRQMNDGHNGDALKTLAEHERRFPGGGLAEERMAARVQALCGLGRNAEAKNDLARLTRAYPHSAHIERARRVCGLEFGSP